MKKLFRLFLFLALLVGGQQSAVGQETNRGFFVPSSGDCGSISNPVTNGTGCLQTTTANGRDAGTIYVYKGSVSGWVAAFGTGSVTSIATTAPLTGGPITTTGTIAIPATTSKVDGYLSSTDWTTFNAKESALTFSSPLTRSTNTIGCQTASASLAGCLSTSDWTAFNAKQAAGNYVTALTGDVTASGPGSVAATIANAAVTYAKIQNVTDARLLGRSAGSAGAPQEITVGTGLSLSAGALTATGQAAGNYITALTGDVTASGPGSVAATIANSAVTLAKIANASANSKLLGSGASGSGAAYTELTLGTNLSMSGTTLNASGASTLGIWLPDAPPSSAGALDTEFGGTTGGTPSGWTETDFGSVLTPTEDPVGALLTNLTAATNSLAGIYKVIPAGDFTVWTKVSFMGPYASFMNAGLCLWQDATSSTGDIESLIFTQGRLVAQERYAAYNSFTSDTAVGSAQSNSINTMYLRIRRTSTTYGMDYSLNGIAWTLLRSGTITITPTHVGICQDNVNTGSTITAYFHFFRYVASDVGINGVMSGARK